MHPSSRREEKHKVDILKEEVLLREDPLQDSIGIQDTIGITGDHSLDKINFTLLPKEVIRKDKDPNILKGTGTIIDSPDLNFREGILIKGMKEGNIHLNKEGIQGLNTGTPGINTGNLRSVIEEILRDSTTGKEWPKRFHQRDMPPNRKGAHPPDKENNIKEMEKITAQTAEGRFMEIPQAVCFVDGAGKQMTEEHLNMNLNNGNIPGIRIRDIKMVPQDEDPLQVGSSALRTG